MLSDHDELILSTTVIHYSKIFVSFKSARAKIEGNFERSLLLLEKTDLLTLQFA